MARDIFGRPLDRHGVDLVDWEGPIADPAIRFDLVPPPGPAYPVRFVLRAREPRLYFDLPSSCGAAGQRKEVLFKGPGRFTMAVSIFTDRDGRDEDNAIEIGVTFADGMARFLKLPVHKADLLCARAVGYRLRQTSAIAPVALKTETLHDGWASAPYAAKLEASGGVPFYHFEITGGSLPDGVSLDSFTGELRGAPKRPVAYEIAVRVGGYDPTSAGASRKLRIRVVGR
jgi:hypothetical protein